MKLQLNENTLNAYINEAMRQELNEAGWLKLGTKGAGKAAAKGAGKKAAPLVQKSGEAFGNLGKSKGAFGFRANSKRVGNARAGLRGAGSERGARFVTGNAGKTMGGQKLEYIVKTVKDEKTGKKVLQFLDKDGKKLTGDQLKLARSNFKLRSQQFKDIRKMGNLNRGIALTAVAGGIGTAVAASQSGSRNPDAPWNDTPENGGSPEPENGGFDGTFPWDNTTPSWTPRNPKPTAPTPAPEETPAQPERPKLEPITPVAAPAGMPTGVTGPTQTLRGVERPESFVDSARRVMGQTAAAGLAGNTGNPKLDNWKQTNRNTRKTASDAIDTMRRDGAITRNQARQDKRTLRDTERTISRNAKDMQNQGQ